MFYTEPVDVKSKGQDNNRLASGRSDVIQERVGKSFEFLLFQFFALTRVPLSSASVWWLVQPQEQIALLDWSQRMAATNKLLLLSDPPPLLCALVSLCLSARLFARVLCVSVCARVHDPEWLVSNKEMKSIVCVLFCFVFFYSPTVNHLFYYFTCTSLSHCACSLACNQVPDKHRQHLSYGQKCWVAINSEQTTRKPQQLNTVATLDSVSSKNKRSEWAKKNSVKR